MLTERRYSALTAGAGRELSGTAITYGEIASLPWGRERFEPGAWGDSLADVRLDVQHERSRIIARTGGGGLELSDGPDALRIRAVPEQTREAADALALVKRGVLRGLSVEFLATETRMERGVRVVERAELAAVSLVDSPAYPGSVPEVRRGGLGLGGSFRYGALRVRSNTERVRKVRVRRGAFAHSLADRKREISLQVGGDPGKLLASRRAGTLDLEDAEDALTFGVERLPNTSYVRDLRAQLDSGLILGVEPTYSVAPVAGAVKLIPEGGGRYAPGPSEQGRMDTASLFPEANTEDREAEPEGTGCLSRKCGRRSYSGCPSAPGPPIRSLTFR